MTKYVEPKTAAERLGVNRQTIWRWIKKGYFDGVRRKGPGPTSPHLIPVDSLLEMADKIGVELDDEIIKEMKQ